MGIHCIILSVASMGQKAQNKKKEKKEKKEGRKGGRQRGREGGRKGKSLEEMPNGDNEEGLCPASRGSTFGVVERNQLPKVKEGTKRKEGKLMTVSKNEVGEIKQ